jgi:hypothetical protein
VIGEYPDSARESQISITNTLGTARLQGVGDFHERLNAEVAKLRKEPQRKKLKIPATELHG